MRRTSTLKIPSETFESSSFARWLSLQSALLYSKIPIGDNTLDGAEGAKLRHMGVRRGVPDFLIVHKRTKRVLWIEMKRRDGGTLSKYQKAWLRALPHALKADGSKQAKMLVLGFYSNEGTKL